MTQDQYVEAMLKIAYHAGCEVARQEVEKEAGDLPRPNIPAKARQYQAPSRGESPAGAAAVNRMAGGPLPKRPQTRFAQPGPRMTMGGRTPGKVLQNLRQRGGGAAVASR